MEVIGAMGGEKKTNGRKAGERRPGPEQSAAAGTAPLGQEQARDYGAPVGQLMIRAIGEK
jgi:hypothetical protein